MRAPYKIRETTVHRSPWSLGVGDVTLLPPLRVSKIVGKKKKKNGKEKKKKKKKISAGRVIKFRACQGRAVLHCRVISRACGVARLFECFHPQERTSFRVLSCDILYAPSIARRIGYRSTSLDAFEYLMRDHSKQPHITR